MISPPLTFCPAKTLTPSIFGFESRPLRLEPRPFLCAIGDLLSGWFIRPRAFGGTVFSARPFRLCPLARRFFLRHLAAQQFDLRHLKLGQLGAMSGPATVALLRLVF